MASAQLLLPWADEMCTLSTLSRGAVKKNVCRQKNVVGANDNSSLPPAPNRAKMKSQRKTTMTHKQLQQLDQSLSQWRAQCYG